MARIHTRRRRFSRWLIALVPLLLPLPAVRSAAPPTVKRTRYPAISPDGRTLCFSYLGDLWTVPLEGGRAARLTIHPARDVQPRYSPDGRSIVFASNRHGNYDLFLMPAEGGEPRRLTYNSAYDFPSGFTPDSQWVVYYAGAAGNGDLYKVRVSGGEPVRLTWDNWEWKYLPRVSPDGKWIAYDFNSTPGAWRHRGYKGSNNADIWLARLATPVEAPARVTTNPGQDFAPLWSPDGQTLYYVSDRDGKVNLWSMDRKGGQQRQLTRHTTDGVRLPDISADGKKIVYEYDSQIRVYDTKSGADHAVPIQAASDARENLNAERTTTTGISEYSVSPDGKKIALLIRGEIFAITAEKGGVARRLTETAERESHLTWNRDSRTITFVSDRSGNKDLFQVDLQGKETRLTETLEDETSPLYSPDGKLLAFHRGDREIVVIPAGPAGKSPAPVAVIPGNFVNVTRYYTPRFSWSPDSRWIAYLDSGDKLEDAVFVYQVGAGLLPGPTAASKAGGAPNVAAGRKPGEADPKVGHGPGGSPAPTSAPGEDPVANPIPPAGKLEPQDGSPAATEPDLSPPPALEPAPPAGAARPVRITEWIRSATPPRWSRDGRLIYFSANPVDNWDIYVVDLQPRDQTFAEDELDRLDRKAPASPGKDGPRGPGAVSAPRQALVRTPDGRVVPVMVVPAPAPRTDPLIEFEGIEQRLRRVTTSAAADNDPVLMPDGKSLLYTSEGNIWSIGLDPDRKSRPTQVTSNGGVGLELAEDGRNAYFVNGGRLFTLSMANRTLQPIPFQATMNVDLAKENRQIFNEVWWVLDRYFYDARHHGVNWQAIKHKYAALLPYAPYREDFYDLMTEMVQELDASHLGISPPGMVDVSSPDETAFLGIEPDWAVAEREGKIRIGRVVAESPADNPKSRLKPGLYILTIDGQEIGKDGTFEALLNRKAGKKVVLHVNDRPSMEGAREVAIRPVSDNAGRDLEYEDWVAGRRRYVEEATRGRIGYVHIRAMGPDDLERFKRELVSKASGKQALILDVRYNPGGHVAPSILDILQKKPWTMVRPRNSDTLVTADWYWGDYDWGKPSALLINQYSTSNAEMMAEGFRTLGIGPVVGVPTSGAVIGTNSWKLLDGGTLRTPSIGIYTTSGENLEGKGRRPDLNVPYDPVAIREGRDPQLDRALQLLLPKLAPANVAQRPE